MLQVSISIYIYVIVYPLYIPMFPFAFPDPEIARQVDEIFKRSLLEDILPTAAPEFTQSTEVRVSIVGTLLTLLVLYIICTT